MTQPRGIRNNNPGNIEAGIEWVLYQSGINRTLNATRTTALIRYVGT